LSHAPCALCRLLTSRKSTKRATHDPKAENSPTGAEKEDETYQKPDYTLEEKGGQCRSGGSGR
ncbi:MAG: hypothetical protein P8X85_17170, partial [Desulfobacterales bacterium]